MPIPTAKDVSPVRNHLLSKFCPNNLSSGLIAAGLVAVLIRLAVFSFTAQHPIVADSGTLISPSIESGTDIRFYQDWRNEIFAKFAGDNPASHAGIKDRRMIPGPMFPALLFVFKYGPGNTWPLAVFFLVAGIGLCLSWLYWLHQQGLSTVSLMLFAFLPHPVYYMICLGTELPFSVIFSVFFFSYFSKNQNRKQVALWSSMLLLLLWTRPNALAVLAFVIIDQFKHHYGKIQLKKLPALLGFLFIGIISSAFFFSYFLKVFADASSFHYFGIPADRYIHGIFPLLPSGLNQACSVVALLGAKVLYFVGLRPSYSGVSLVYVLVRAIPGPLFLIGLFVLFAKGESRHKQLIMLFILPVLLTASQDRYSVPIQPILFFYFAKAFDRMSLSRWKSATNPCPVNQFSL